MDIDIRPNTEGTLVSPFSGGRANLKVENGVVTVSTPQTRNLKAEKLYKYSLGFQYIVSNFYIIL